MILGPGLSREKQPPFGNQCASNLKKHRPDLSSSTMSKQKLFLAPMGSLQSSGKYLLIQIIHRIDEELVPEFS